MTTDARHLMSVSLGKIAQARAQRGGMKLHHSLLVATVLHKARSAFMEETLRMVDSLRCQPVCGPNDSTTTSAAEAEEFAQQFAEHHLLNNNNNNYDEDDDDVDDMSKVGIPCLDSFTRHRYVDDGHHSPNDFASDSSTDPLSLWSDADDYPAPPTPGPVVVEKVVTIFDLDTRVSCQESALCDITNDDHHAPSSSAARKRARDEVEEAVSSIVPKRPRGEDDLDAGLDLFGGSGGDDRLPAPPSSSSSSSDACVQSLTNLVSIFSFKSRCYSTTPQENVCPSPPASSAPASSAVGPQPALSSSSSALTRSVSTPELCASQVFHRREEHVSRPAIAMTV